jgi:glutathione S-transferase
MQAAPFSPILYSFRRCPYAMRARMALSLSRINVEIREIELKHKPTAMLAISPKGTVPVLQINNEHILEESLDIMRFALDNPANTAEVAALISSTNMHALLESINDAEQLAFSLSLIEQNDGEFKSWLDKYKYTDRHPEQGADFYRQQGERFIAQLEACLNEHTHTHTQIHIDSTRSAFLTGQNLSLADLAIFPFVRQFAHVDLTWFNQSQYPLLKRWLTHLMASPLFEHIMVKYPVWQEAPMGKNAIK